MWTCSGPPGTDYDEFLSGFTGKQVETTSPVKQRQLSKAEFGGQLLEEIRHKVYIGEGSLRQSFRKFDLNHDGVLSKVELFRGLQRLGIRAPREHFEELVRALGTSRTVCVAGVT